MSYRLQTALQETRPESPIRRFGPRAAAWALALLPVVAPVALSAQVGAPEEPSDRADATEAANGYRHAETPVANAVRAGNGISVDGVLDEPIWSTAVPVTDFVQELPFEGERATQRTEIRFVYDDDGIYVGATLYDERPITTELRRRDASGEFDYLMVMFDSFHDHETAYRFALNPSGSYLDAVVGGGGGGGGRGGGGGGGPGGGGGDNSWDPVWTRATQVNDDGWTVEMRIPFSQLRFSREEEQTWGVRVERQINATQELVVWPFIPTLERQGPSRFAHLEGLRGLDRGRGLELLPYVTGRAEYLNLEDPPGVTFENPYRSGDDYFGDVGMDLKYRLTSNVTLDATVNPDFGQVEVDPSVINLTAFETRYEERRPFFVEGADIFSVGEGGPGGSTGQPPQLLYSRRIGRAPQGSVPSSAAFADVATTTTILGAAKITGRTASGWSLGFLEAVTGEESARFVDGGNMPGEAVVEPRTNYVVGRARRQIRGGETRFGVIGSAVNRALDTSGLESRLHSAAYSGGVDFAHEWSDRTYRISGLFTTSYVQGDADAIARTQRSSTRYYDRPDADHLTYDPTRTSLSGYYGFVDLVKQSGAFNAKGAIAFASPGYEVNDLGFQSASDRIILDTNFSYSQPIPGSVFRNWNVRGSPDGVWNYAGDRVHGEVNGNFNFQLLNYWGGGIRLSYNPRNDDDRLTRGGPLASTPRRFAGNVSFNSDSRRALLGRARYGWQTDEAGGWRHEGSFDLTARPSEMVEVRFGPSLVKRLETAQYVTAVTDPFAIRTFGERYVFADLDQTTLSFETRVNVTFTPDVSLQLYLEPFISVGDYRDLKEFRQPGRFDFDTYGVDAGDVTQEADGSYTVDPDGAGPASDFTVDNRDFSYRSLIGNAVLRWDWREGSSLYFVWQQSRINALTNRGPNGNDPWVGTFDFGRDAGDMFSGPTDNIFAIKVNYWFSP